MTTIGQRLIEQIGREVDRCDADAALKLAQTLACLPDRWALSEIPDAPKGPEPKPESKHLYYTKQRYRREALSKEVEQDIADHEQEHREDAAKEPVTKPVTDLCAGDLGRIIETNGYRGRLRIIEVTEEGGYVRLWLTEQHDDGARFPVLVKLDMPVRVMPEVTA